jgi:hypothetical protein
MVPDAISFCEPSHQGIPAPATTAPGAMQVRRMELVVRRRRVALLGVRSPVAGVAERRWRYDR